MGTKIGGLDEVISTVALSLNAFIQAVKLEIPDIRTVYDEKLSYETALEAVRANNNLEQITADAFPVFAFRRSVLRYADPSGPGRRASGILAKRNVNGSGLDNTSEIYRLVHGEYDVNFLYITKDVSSMEKFEILYLAEEGISSYKELEVDLNAELGLSLPYYVDYPPLEDKVFETDGNFYKMIQGTVKIRGFYPVLRAKSKHILEINAKIRDAFSGIYTSIQITPQ